MYSPLVVLNGRVQLEAPLVDLSSEDELIREVRMVRVGDRAAGTRKGVWPAGTGDGVTAWCEWYSGGARLPHPAAREEGGDQLPIERVGGYGTRGPEPNYVLAFLVGDRYCAHAQSSLSRLRIGGVWTWTCVAPC